MNAAGIQCLIGVFTAGVSAEGYVVAGIVSLVVSASIAVLVAVLLAACFPAGSGQPRQARRAGLQRGPRGPGLLDEPMTRSGRPRSLSALGAGASLLAAVL
ncbi:MAG: hypothetical protein M3179_08180, partial [Actinomycetota bacterium]|nr:hypothetical protein [Actinomycetota bacterium]